MTELIEVKTIAEVERIVNGSPLWDGTGEVEFSNDGIMWAPSWSPTDEHPHPQFARVSVFRKEVRVPTTVTIRWDEQYPAASEEWSGKWDRSPMRHFGRTVRMVAYRQTFRELLGNTVIEDEDRTDRAEAAPAATDEPAPRDWAAEIADAESDTMLDEIEKEGRALRIFTADGPGTALWLALRARRREIAAGWQDAQTAWDAPAETAPETADAAEQPRRAPQDYLPPANRAERRKAARKKKGGRR